MAKAQSIACVDHNAGAYEWFAGVIRCRFDEVVSYFPAAIAENNVEGVYSMRVATRRLRSAISDFELVFDKLDLKRTHKALSRLADVLGAVRDQDVFIEALMKYRAKAPDETVAAGIDELLAHHRKLRTRAHGKLSRAVTPVSLERIRTELTASVDAQVSEPGLFGPGTIRAAAGEVISARLDDLFVSNLNIYDPGDDKAIHKLRIRAKRLRYAIEQFGECSDGAIEPFADEVAKLQSALGEANDTHLWVRDLARRLKKDRHQTKPAERAAAVFLLAEFEVIRANRYRAGVRIWEKWRSDDLPRQVRAAIVQPSSISSNA